MYLFLQIFGKMEALHVEVSEFLHCTEKNIVTEDEPVKECVQRQIVEMKDLLKMERNEYEVAQSDFPAISLTFIKSYSDFMLIYCPFSCRYCFYQS